MANDVRMSNTLINAQGAAGNALFNTGYLRIYNGTRPATAEVAVTSQTLLAECRFGSTAFGSPVAGVSTANAISGEDATLADGTATWARALQSDGSTVLEDYEVGVTGADLNLNSVDIVSGVPLTITSFVRTMPKVSA